MLNYVIKKALLVLTSRTAINIMIDVLGELAKRTDNKIDDKIVDIIKEKADE